MATRSVTGEILRHDGSPWSGAVIKFTLLRNAYTVSPAVTYPVKPLARVTDENGEFSVTLASGLGVQYEVTLPSGETFEMYVPEGSSITLEQLRFAYDGSNPTPPEDWQDFVETAFAESATIQEIIEDRISTSIPDSDTIDSTYNDGSGILNLEVKPNTTQQKVGVRKNSTGSTHVRQRVNFIEGTGVTLTVADDEGSDEVDVTIAAAAALAVKEANSNVVAAATSIDFNGTDFNVTDGTSGRAVVALAGGGGGGGAIELKEDNVQVISAMTALDFDGDHFNVADSGSGRGTITLASPGGGGGGGGTGSTTISQSMIFQDGSIDSGVVVAVGTKGYLRVPFDCTITGWTVIADTSTTAVLDVWKIAAGTALPSASIAGSAKPTLTADDVVNSTTLTGWTTSVTAGDLIGWEVESNDNAHQLTLQVNFDRVVVNQYTDEDARDAIATALTDSASIDFSANDGANTITAIAKYGGSGGDYGTADTLARSDHDHDAVYAPLSHTQAASTITDFTEAAQDAVGAMVADTTTVNATYTDATPELKLDVIDNTSTQKVLVNKSGGTAVGPRREINFIEDTGMTITVVDNPGADRVDVTLASSGGGGGGSMDVKEGNVNVVAGATAIDFDASDFNVSAPGSGRALVALAYGTSAGTPAEGNHVHVPADVTGLDAHVNELARDAVGAALTDSTSIDFTPNDAGDTITAAVIYGGSGGNAGTAATASRYDHNHDANSITGAAEFVDDRVDALIQVGGSTGLTKTYDDGLGTYTLAANFGTGSTQVAAGNHVHTTAGITGFDAAVQELARDAVGDALTDSTSIDFSVNDGADTITAAVIYAGSGGNFGTANTSTRSDHTHTAPTLDQSLNFPFGDEDGLGSVIATTARRIVNIPRNWGTCTLTGWRILASPSATVTIDIWKDSYSNYPPVNADSMVGGSGTKPFLTATDHGQATSFTSWASTTFTGGDVLVAEVEANNNAKFLLLVLEFSRTL